MQIVLWTPHRDLKARSSTQAADQRRLVHREHSRVRDHCGVRSQKAGMLAEEVRQICTADLFFSFKYAFHVDGQPLGRCKVRFKCLQMKEKLSLVIRGAAPTDFSVSQYRCKRR